jgi:hypothetical protein
VRFGPEKRRVAGVKESSTGAAFVAEVAGALETFVALLVLETVALPPVNSDEMELAKPLMFMFPPEVQPGRDYRLC